MKIFKKNQYKKIKKDFIKGGWAVVSKKYKPNIPLFVICNKGHLITITYENYKKGDGCVICNEESIIVENICLERYESHLCYE